MSSSRFRGRVVRAALLAAALSARPVIAADRPATSEGAQQLRDILARFVPAAAPSLVTVKPEDSNYLVSVDLSALNGLFKAAGVAVLYDPATLGRPRCPA